MKEEIKKKYIVRDKIVEALGVSTLQFDCDNEVLYCPGQFINVYFPELGTPEGKAYSISSAPYEGTMNITVRAIGEFSNKLCSMKKGDTVTASLPYGYFYSESEDRPLVLAAAGIGITPFRSMVYDILNKNPNREIILFFSNRTEEDIVFKNEFDELCKKYTNFKVYYFITREEALKENGNTRKGRLNAGTILGFTNRLEDAEFLICGSISFVSDLWKGLKKAGVGEEAIYTEAFFSH